MFRRILSLALAASLFGVVSLRPVYADSKAEKEARFAKKVKENINKLGTGATTRIEVKLRDKRTLKGYIGEVGEDGFSVVDAKTGTATRVLYPQVQKVKGNNLSTGAKIAIGLGVVAAILAILLILENYG